LCEQRIEAIATVPNPDLEVIRGNKSRWTHADHRRRGFHNLHRIARYNMSFRAARVMQLEKRMDLRIGDLEAVRNLTSVPWFSAMVVVRGPQILYEHYARDFDQDSPHSIQSITKTTMHLVVGRLVEQGMLDLNRRIAEYLPEIGSGYANATLQQVLNMDVMNDYSENFADPEATYYQHEEAMGWRLPRDIAHEETQRRFLARITSEDTLNRTGFAQYKDANTDVVGWVVERATGRSLRSFLADIVDAAGLAGAFHITTDREGVPTLDGGACLTARDLTRYLSLFVRRGRGVGGEMVGSESFLAETLLSGVAMPFPYENLRYSNQLMVSDRSVSHAGWGGQYAIANLDTGTIGVYLGVFEDQHAAARIRMPPLMRMLDWVTGPEFGGGDA
jgi:CubicO group peptidase (beta-lactamase class C family)